ncbi:MAG: heterodisulfide reductase-related iron-sulfur binding cluster [Puniceicoccaceae bacterium]
MMNELSREIYGNIDSLSKIVFYLLAVLSICCFVWGIWIRLRIWRLRHKGGLNLSQVANRIFSKVFLQKKVRSGPRKWGAGLAHAGLFFGFLVLFIGTCLVAAEEYSQLFLGRDANDPIFHKGLYYALFELTLDIGGLALLAGCGYFIWRRIAVNSSMENRISDWVVVLTLLYLGISGYVIEGARIILEGSSPAWVSPVGLVFAVLFEGMGMTTESASAFHKVNWWMHAIAALGFVAAIPYCRLLHVVAGAVNIALRDYEMGRLDPVSFEEVEEKGYVGSGSVGDLSGAQLIALDACVSCGRCQDACPAYLAGKPLSPRDVIQDIRAEVLKLDFAQLSNPEGTAASSLDGVISEETLWSCTTCNACVDACPVDVAPLEFITDMRRYWVGEGALRGTPAASLQKMQRSGNPWGMPANERFDWADGLGVQTVRENPEFDVLYWVGCAASYDPRTSKVARATVKLLQAAGVNFACLGPEEKCTGDSARRMGEEFLFQELAEANVDTLNRYKVRRIVTHCPHCLNALSRDYSQFGGSYEVMHHSQLLQELLSQGKLVLTGNASGRKVTYHDPCYLARTNSIIKQPREVLEASLQNGQDLIEMKRNGCGTGCCGGGGGRMWFDDKPEERIGRDRIAEVQQTEASVVAVSCPFCLTMMQDGLAAVDSDVDVRDVAELMAEALD